MPIPSNLSNRGSLTINSVNMRGTAWWVLDYMPLLGMPNFRGKNLPIPHSNGQHPYPRRKDETTYSLEMLICSDKTSAGGSTADPISGLRTNLDELLGSVCGPYGTETHSATFTPPSGTTMTASVQCQLTIGRIVNATLVRAVLDVTVPAGRFA